MPSSYRQDIQTLRGLFVIAVVLFHFFPDFFPNGYLGVDGFFVISGYVLAPQLQRIFIAQHPLIEYRIFIQRRIFRLYPAFLVAISISLVLLFFFISPAVHKRSLFQILASLINLGDFGAFRFSGNYFDASPNPFVHFWSLSVEWQFYILFPLSTILFVKYLQNSKGRIVSVFALTTTLISLLVWINQSSLETALISLGLGNYSLGFGYYFGLGRFWQFLVGFLTFTLIQKERHVSSKYIGLIFPSLLILLLWQGLVSEEYRPMLMSFFCSLALIFLPSNGNLFILNKIEKVMVFIGKISYSVYLIHFPFAVAYRHNYDFLNLSTFQDVVFRIILILVVLLIGSALFEIVEERYRTSQVSLVSNHKKGIYSLLFLCSLSLGIFYIGISSAYFGLGSKTEKPPYESYIGDNCAGNSLDAVPCVGNPDGRQGAVVLLGDSHAEHFSQSFFESSSDLNFIYYGIGFCAPALEVYKDMREGCYRFSLQAKSEIEAIRPDVLVVSVLIANDEMVIPVSTYISSLRASVGRVVVLVNSPYFQEPIFVSHPIVHQIPEFSKGSSLNNMDLNFNRLSVKFSQRLQRLGIPTIDISRSFCSDSYCHRYEEGEWLFVDQHHFSSFGAARLRPLFTNILKNRNLDKLDS